MLSISQLNGNHHVSPVIAQLEDAGQTDYTLLMSPSLPDSDFSRVTFPKTKLANVGLDFPFFHPASCSLAVSIPLQLVRPAQTLMRKLTTSSQNYQMNCLLGNCRQKTAPPSTQLPVLRNEASELLCPLRARSGCVGEQSKGNLWGFS